MLFLTYKILTIQFCHQSVISPKLETLYKSQEALRARVCRQNWAEPSTYEELFGYSHQLTIKQKKMPALHRTILMLLKAILIHFGPIKTYPDPFAPISLPLQAISDTKHIYTRLIAFYVQFAQWNGHAHSLRSRFNFLCLVSDYRVTRVSVMIYWHR